MSGLDPTIHAPARLRLCAMLSAVDELEFAKARDALEVSDSVLSKHVAALAEAGYAKARKEALGGRRTTWLSLTRTGRAALALHLAALQAVIDAAGLPAGGEAPV